jgi:hypothetical protein
MITALSPAETRAEARRLRSEIRVLQFSKQLQAGNIQRVRLHNKAIMVAQNEIEALCH